MANDVFANGREISCKKADGKSICAFPDVCFTPPQTPATPPGVPIPYPNTAFAKDTTKGSKSVKISGKEVMLKNKSYFKRSSGDEAGRAPKKGVMTSKITGKVYFTSWSPNVKFEGKNVVRHFDLTTHNHGSDPGNSPPWAYQDAQTTAPIQACQKEAANKKEKCEDKGLTTREEQCNDDECKAAKKCLLVTYNQGKRTGEESQVACCPGETPHHLVEVHCFTEQGQRNSGQRLSGFGDYNDKDAPCVCVKGTRYSGEHGQLHAIQNTFEKQCMDPNGGKSQMGGANNAWTYGKAKEGAVKAHQTAFPKAGKDKACSKECIEKQLDNYHEQIGVKDDNTPLRADRSPLKEEQKEWGKQQLERIG
ncbi:MAG: PAAR-like domain-containing protein [Pseudomonadota bacterium]|nr:PAAR-like domain-containing protein [Pseudomonadota bacterium]